MPNVKMLKCSNVKMNRGFTLIETLFAAFVLIVGFVAVMSLIHRATASTQLASSRLTAAYLAQEGIEIVRNIRDSNWLAQGQNPTLSWDQNLGVGDWEADFDDFALTFYQARNLRVNGGFYNYASGQDTKFRRRINIAKPDPSTISLAVEVSWSERGEDFSVVVQKNLYNWR